MVFALLDSLFELLIPQKKLLTLADLKFLHENNQEILDQDQQNQVSNIISKLIRRNKKPVPCSFGLNRRTEHIRKEVLTKHHEQSC